jgi:hypothetical protein
MQQDNGHHLKARIAGFYLTGVNFVSKSKLSSSTHDKRKQLRTCTSTLHPNTARRAEIRPLTTGTKHASAMQGRAGQLVAPPPF